MTSDTARAPVAVGLGVRWAFTVELADEVERGAVHLPCVEIVPENFLWRGDEVREAARTLARHTRVLSHGLAANLAGEDPLDVAYLRRIRDFLDALGVERHTDHLCVTGHGGGCLHELLPPVPTRDAVRRCAGRIRAAEDVLGRPMAVENVTTYLWPEGDLDPVDFVAEVVEAADCGLLLDLNNLVVNARNLGGDPRAALERLPLDRVVHLHVAGGTYWPAEAVWVDTHGAGVPRPVRDLLAAFVAARRGRGPLPPVVYERDANVPHLDELLAECEAVAACAMEAPAPGEDRPAPEEARPPPPPAPRRAPVPETSTRRLDALVRALRDPDAETATRHAATFLGGRPPQMEARLSVYRTLIRRTLSGILEGLMPSVARTHGRRRLSDDLEAFLASGTPLPPILREVPATFVAWAARHRWHDTPQVTAEAIADLAVADARVAPRGPADDVALDPALVPDRPMVFCRSLQLVPAVPGAGAPALAIHRDAAGTIRRLELSDRAYDLLEHAVAGVPLARVADRWGRTPDDFAALEAFLTALAERGILLGTRRSAAAQDPPPERP
ncbi:MAG: DUF692 family protein [Deltaproteobacteria bacterium]|nr:MAG: DUF692 family protein [Deltaproteobacteria bacterium]